MRFVTTLTFRAHGTGIGSHTFTYVSRPTIINAGILNTTSFVMSASKALVFTTVFNSPLGTQARSHKQLHLAGMAFFDGHASQGMVRDPPLLFSL